MELLGKSMVGPHVVLVHGFAAKRLWMRFLERRFQKYGYATSRWGYPWFYGSLERHARRLRAVLEDKAERGSHVHLVAHSMGAIVARLAISYGPLPSFGRVVQIAPPNHGSHWARLFSPLFYPICPAVSELSNHPSSLVNTIAPLRDVEIGVIGARFDVFVPIANTQLEGQTDHVCIKATHNSLLFQTSAIKQIHSFLSTGSFVSTKQCR